MIRDDARDAADPTLDLLAELGLFSQRIGRPAEITLRENGAGFMNLVGLVPPLRAGEKCFWPFGSIDQLRGIMRGQE